ncbi:MAG: diguanylate cyclase [Candidatus Competibacteraceae bacterium]
MQQSLQKLWRVWVAMNMRCYSRKADVDHAIQLANTINALLASISFAVGGHQDKISAGIGIVLFPVHGDNVADLLANADLAVSQAKLKGHGQWHVCFRTRYRA